MSKLNKEPLLHITKRKELPLAKTWAIRIGAIVAALIETYQKLWVPVFAHMSINAIATASDYSGVLRGLHLESCWYLIMAALLFAALYPICRIIAKSGKRL